jgi:alpha-galactosidase
MRQAAQVQGQAQDSAAAPEVPVAVSLPVAGLAVEPVIERPAPSGRRPKIVLLGAGSTVFAKNLLGDILSEPALSGSAIWLYDIDQERLDVSSVVARRIVRTLGASARIEATTDLGRALDGADYAINMIQVGGYRPCTVTDFEIPNRYGLRQTIGDTLGIGGIMRGLRTIPVLLGMTGEMQRRCPDVLHLNYVNPMAMNCRALSEASRIKTVGLCHSVQGTAAELATAIGVPVGEIDYLCAGINHMAFYLRFSRQGEDLYPRIRQVVTDGRVPRHDQVRYDLLQRFGYFVTESSEHVAEYVPWYIKRSRPELVQRLNIPLDEYPRRCVSQIADWTGLARTLQDPAHPLTVVRSNEYGGRIINAIETGRPVVVYGNVPNEGLIDNLPREACVEVPCLVDGTGLHPVRVGRLPLQLTALMQTNITVQALTVEAALTGRREHVYHAAMLDPHTAAELDLDQIRCLVDDLLEAHRAWLPDAMFG